MDASLFEDTTTTTTIDHSLSIGLRQFGEGLEQLQSKGSEIFLRSADDASVACTVLHTSSEIANERAVTALRHLPPTLRQRFDGMMCVAEIYRALLYEREAIRVGAPQPTTSENYSRIGDVLTFMAKQPDIMACINAHRTITDAYALAAVPVPCLHFRHHMEKGRRCLFKSIYSS